MFAELRQSLYTRLASYSALTSLLSSAGAIYDFLPQELADQDAEFPFLIIGEYAALEFDTDDRIGTEFSVSLHAWSRYRGKKQCAEILDACYDALHRYTSMSVTGYNVIDVRWDGTTQIMQDPDGLTYHGVIGFSVVMDKVA